MKAIILAMVVALLALGCKSNDIKRYEKAKDKIAKRAEKICPDVATGISTAGGLAIPFLKNDDAEDVGLITADLEKGATGLCGVLIEMRADEASEEE